MSTDTVHARSNVVPFRRETNGRTLDERIIRGLISVGSQGPDADDCRAAWITFCDADLKVDDQSAAIIDWVSQWHST